MSINTVWFALKIIIDSPNILFRTLPKAARLYCSVRPGRFRLTFWKIRFEARDQSQLKLSLPLLQTRYEMMTAAQSPATK